MGLFSKIFGVDKFRRGMDVIWSQVQEAARRGQSEFTVTVRETDFPIVGTALESLTDHVIAKLTERGYVINNVSMEPWGGVAFVQISQVSQAGQEPVQADASPVDAVALTAWPTALPAIPTEIPDDLGAQHRLVVEQLATLGGEAWIGRPYGYREDFELAYDLVAAAIPDERGRRWVAKQVALALIEHFRSQAFTFDIMDRVMGVTQDDFDRFGLLTADRDRCWRLKADSTSLLADFAQGDGDSVKRWAFDHTMVIAVYTFHVVAWHRMATQGNLPSLEVSDLPTAWT